MTDTQLDLDAILAAHASASPYGRTEVAGRFHASYYADDADVALVFASVPALVAALRKAEAKVAAVLALHEPEDVPSSGHYYCDPDDCNRAGEGVLVARCQTCELVHPCPTRVAITDTLGGAS